MTSAENLVDASHPWPGPIPFDEGAQAYFYGRDAAVEELIRLIARDVGVTLFGRSGLGKTSLLQAGVFPRLREGTFLPISIRLNYSQDYESGEAVKETPEGNYLENQIGKPVPDLVVQIAQSFFHTMAEARIAFPPLSREDDLWSYLHRSDFVEAVLSQGAIPVFVFDQFEELFTRGMADPARQTECVDLLDLLADLIQGRVPSGLRKRFELYPEQMGRLRLDQPAYRIVIALREDYLPFLEELSARAPMFNRSRFRLLPMNRDEALLAVEEPGRSVLDKGVAQLIISVLAGDDRTFSAPGEIDPSILSLFCHELNVRRLALRKAKVDRSFVSDERDQILASYYERCFDGVPERVRDFAESELITEGGVRVEVSLENAIKNSGGDRRPFDMLATKRLVRFENRPGSTRMELVHDVLVEPMRKSAEHRAQQLKIAEAEAAQRDAARLRFTRLRRAFFVSVGSLIIVGTLLLSLSVSMSNQQKARAQSQLVSCVMPMFGTGRSEFKDGLRGRDALLAVTSKIQSEVDCGAGLPELMQRTGSQRSDTILWAVGLSTMPGSSKKPDLNVRRIEAALDLKRTGQDEANDDARDADARLAQAELWRAADNLGAAADAISVAANLYRNKPLHRNSAGILRLADLLNREGELRTELRQWQRAKPLLSQALTYRKQVLFGPARGPHRLFQQGRFLLAQSYSALGRLALRENASIYPKQFAAITNNEATSSSLTKSGYRAYELCMARNDKEGAGQGLKREDPSWEALASFCLNHRITTLLAINTTLAKGSVSKLLSMANVDLNTIPESEKQKYFDVLQFMSDYYRREYMADPSNDAAKRLNGTYSRWLVKVKRDVFAQGPTPERLQSLVDSLNGLSQYYQMTGQLELATATSARACLLSSQDPNVYTVWGTALALADRAEDAQTLYGRASRLFKSSAQTRKSIQYQLSNLNRTHTPSVERVTAAMHLLDRPLGERAIGRCDDGFQGEL